MKICDITDAYHPTGGGIRTYIDEKVRFIRRFPEHEHALVGPADRDTHEQDGCVQVFGVRSPVIPGCSPYRALLRSGRVAAILDRLRPDVIELGNPYLQPRGARGFGRRHGAVVAGFYHTDFPSAYVETTVRRGLGARAGGAARRAAEHYAGYVHRKLDLTLVASPALEAKLARLEVPGVERVTLGVDLDVYHPERRDLAWRRELGLTDEDTLLIFAGRVDREKRVDLLVEMMGRLPASARCMLAVLGQGPQWARLEEATRQNPRVRFLPFERDRERFGRCLASADIYVSAARYETFGLSVIEAQAAGLAVMGQRAGAMVDRVPPSTGILVDEPDPGAMAAAVTAMIQNGHRHMGREARRLAEANYDWEKTFRHIFTLYAKCCARRSEGGHVLQPA